MKSIPTIFVLFLLIFGNKAFTQNSVGSYFDSLLAIYSDSGFSGAVLVAEQKHISLKKGYGFASIEKKKLNTPQTLFNVASIGKQFTAYSVLLLEQQKRLKTSDYVSSYIGKFNDHRDSTTIHHLLIHSSGLFSQTANLDYSTRAKFIQSIKHNKEEAQPGKQYRYSNAGYSLLAAIVEIVSGQPFETFLLNNVFQPAGMEHTGYPWEKRMDTELFATGYDKNGNPVAPQQNLWAARGPGNLMTSVEDLHKWIIAIQNEKFMPAGMKEKILFDYLPGKETYSWNKVITSRKTHFYHKGGGRSDFESQLMWYPEEDIVIIFFINNDYNLRGKIFRKLTEHLN